ncbi:hypothetical protein [Burkholderia ubonensis]|uniref:hypothetical protein n=1 Tax=Burkholderia ubonensis TaxID=101571 RepID=UPI000754D6E2|nr:hypothetical protein [Burkholderia ubonensis]KVD28196.1 hypothetical protein WI83_23610 [Burkholderia ubonensis]KVG74314.1 hypothetical protein WJ34_12855 [Burkholderia ubonensis]KVH24898.1 hypothetical protein WJ37_08070 [Burkholderia ubonensis]KVH51679.1 hypothetical protein WJ38_08170 [Burkholderia ubonensis]KVH86150.1 hypothetical protein WJ43_08510 [Burkholderia ubonensis]
MAVRYVTIAKFAAEAGCTERDVKIQIRNGTYRQGEIWVKAPDGRILIDMQGYEKWIELIDDQAQIKKFAAETGYTETAVRARIHDGTWAEGEVWTKAADGRILIDVQGFEKWVETGGAADA